MNMAWQITGDPFLDQFLLVVLVIVAVCLAVFLLFGRRQ